MIPRRRASALLIGLALLAPIVCLPLLQQPRLGIGAGAAAIFTLLLWASPGNALGLAHAGDLTPVLGGGATSGASLALFLALAAATSFALIRHPERLPSGPIYYVPVVCSLALFLVMVVRLPGPPTNVYGSHKLETYLIVNVALLAAGIVVGTRRRDVRRSLGLMLLVALGAGVALVHEIATGVQPTFAGRYAISNEAYDPIALGRLAAAGLLIGLYVLLAERKYRLVGVVAVPLMTITLLASGGRGSLLGVIAGMIVLFGVGSVFAVRRSAILAAIAASLVVASLVVPGAAVTRATSVLFGGSEGLNSGGRTALWSAAWHAFLAHPLGGLGTGGFAALDLPENYPHNLLLEIAAELGVIGLVPLLLTLGVGFAIITRAIRRGPVSERGLPVLVAALLASAFVNALFSTDIPANYDVWLYLGLGVGMASQLELPAQARTGQGAERGVTTLRAASVRRRSSR